jgi:hypothetical protein
MRDWGWWWVSWIWFIIPMFTICLVERYRSLKFYCCPLVYHSLHCWYLDRCIYTACLHSFEPFGIENNNELVRKETKQKNKFDSHLLLGESDRVLRPLQQPLDTCWDRLKFSKLGKSKVFEILIFCFGKSCCTFGSRLWCCRVLRTILRVPF